VIRVILMLGLGWVLWSASGRLEQVVEAKAALEEAGEDPRILLTGVEMTSYELDGSQGSQIEGTAARVTMKLDEIELDQARVTLIRDGETSLVMTGRLARKLEAPEGGDRYEVEGDVRGRSVDGRELFGDLVQYESRTERGVCPLPATITTTTSRIHGNRLEGLPSLERGTAFGNVEIAHRSEEDDGVLQVWSDEAAFDLRADHHRAKGHVRVRQGETQLEADFVDAFLEPGAKRIEASGERVTANDADVKVICSTLSYDVDGERIRARGDQAPPVAIVEGEGERQELRAATMLISTEPGKRWVLGEGDVHFINTPDGAQPGDEVIITSERVEAFHDVGRATFEGNVRVEATRGRARSRHGIYYRESRRVYLSGDAEAWENDASGRPARHVQGDRIRYDLDSGRSVVIGGVRGVLDEGRR
jgi:lipopolysaccharide export system protein LptA